MWISDSLKCKSHDHRLDAILLNLERVLGLQKKRQFYQQFSETVAIISYTRHHIKCLCLFPVTINLLNFVSFCCYFDLLFNTKNKTNTITSVTEKSHPVMPMTALCNPLRIVF